MQPLREVKRFVDGWHRGAWCARALPDAVGAEVV